MHWAYGTGSAALYGIVAGSLRRPRAVYGLPFGAAVWAASYVVLPEGGLYKPIWEYDAQDPGLGPERAPRLRGGHRGHVLGARDGLGVGGGDGAQGLKHRVGARVHLGARADQGEQQARRGCPGDGQHGEAAPGGAAAPSAE